MELTLERATEIAERIVELEPWTCDVRLFPDDDGVYRATVLVQLGDPTDPNITRTAEQLRQLADLIEAEGIKVVSAATLNLTLAHRDAKP